MSRFQWATIGAQPALLQYTAEPVRDVRVNRYEWNRVQHPDLVWNRLWTPSGFVGGSSGLFGMDAAQTGDWFEWPVDMYPGGARSGYFFCGVTRDSTGTALASCTVKVFRTSDDALVASCISSFSGEYCVETPYWATNHYLNAYLAGSPDVAGTTVNTLQPDATRTY